MDAVGGSIIESPIAMAHEQLPSPLTFDGPFAIGGGSEDPSITAANPRRRPSKGHQSGIVKRSASSPNVRSLSTSSESALSLSEKRRNKLGYHRTSVACVHCRRRKIRCLLAPDDPQNRCSNCIRLKKECNFYPVDQQPENERRPRTGSKNEGKSGPGSVSSSSSPNVAGSRPSEHGDAFVQFQHLPHSAYTASMMTIGSNMSPPGSAGWDMRFFEGQHIPSSHPSSGGDEHAQNPFWKVPDTPLTPANFSPYATTSASGLHYPHPTWPMRSMSYDEHTHQQQRHDSHGNIAYGGSPIDHLRRSTIDMPPPAAPPLGGHPPTLPSTGGVTMAGDISGHVMNANQLGYPGVPQGWSMLPAQSPKSVEFGGGPWYPDPNALAKVSEDEVSHFGGSLQGGMYANR